MQRENEKHNERRPCSWLAIVSDVWAVDVSINSFDNVLLMMRDENGERCHTDIWKTETTLTISMPRNMARLAGKGIYLRAWRKWPKDSEIWEMDK